MCLAETTKTYQSTSARVSRRPTWLRIAVIGIGTLLVMAAAAKMVAPADALKLQVLLNAAPGSVATIVAIELVIGLTLIFGVINFYLWLCTTALFLMFAAVASYLFVSGIAACGCFGEVKVPPAVMLIVDGVILLLLIGFRHLIVDDGRRGGWSMTRMLPIAVGLLGLAASVLAERRSNSLAASQAENGLVILEPKTWIGKPFPIVTSISPSFGVMNGDWNILIYHHECPECQMALPAFQLRAAQTSGSSSSRYLALEVPPAGDDLPIGGANFAHARLSEANEWFVQAPVEIRLEGGKVTRVSRGSQY